MRQVIEILRLKHEHDLSIREIGRSFGLASSTVGDYLLRAEAAGLKWPLPEGVDETELEARLCAVAPPRIAETPPPPIPDWAHLHAELRRPNVTHLRTVIDLTVKSICATPIRADDWARAPYQPTPTIIEAARALYAHLLPPHR